MPQSAVPQPGRRCSVCAHPQAQHIDLLLVTGTPSDGRYGMGRRALAKKFGLCESSIYNHMKKHISAKYRQAILAGSSVGEKALRELVVEEGHSVLENFKSLHLALKGRFLRALDADDDALMLSHARVMIELLWKMGKLTREVAPSQTLIQNNTVIAAPLEQPEFIEAITKLTIALRPFPEARKAATEALRALPGRAEPKLIEAS
jgi:hypothetical protein